MSDQGESSLNPETSEPNVDPVVSEIEDVVSDGESNSEEALDLAGLSSDDDSAELIKGLAQRLEGLEDKDLTDKADELDGIMDQLKGLLGKADG